MSQYDNEKSGVLFKNDKEGNEKRPDYKGSIQIEGVEYWLSAWIKDGKKGKFMSLKAEAKKSASDAYTAKPSEPMQNDPDFDSDLPF